MTSGELEAVDGDAAGSRDVGVAFILSVLAGSNVRNRGLEAQGGETHTTADGPAADHGGV
ncbi:hypothetical protein FHX44_116847 [Pseudonocardia hierapolitana]|uniref:Uncharacterized protein n=1 Tax=Pseudonocardia hierapolitana TaxID=1128676 RepID=A0A561T1B2_9PSEU|nr:hypothetical protein [Pseudonocardia hierapolitana]TWF80904.1 hypothetical protein FHX44_116847 [Pseudonocardia hierapolitana]